MSAERPAPSPFLLENRSRLEASAALGPVADVACGRGRHALTCAEWGLRVLALDRNADALAELARAARAPGRSLQPIRCDLESDPEIPLVSGCCGAVLVFCFLFRPLAPRLVETLAPGGWLLYETFTRRQLELGTGPRNPDFLLTPGELPRLFPDLEVVSWDEGITGGDRPLALARLLARRPL